MASEKVGFLSNENENLEAVLELARIYIEEGRLDTADIPMPALLELYRRWPELFEDVDWSYVNAA